MWKIFRKDPNKGLISIDTDIELNNAKECREEIKKAVRDSKNNPDLEPSKESDYDYRKEN